jgi:hypothetical protein
LERPLADRDRRWSPSDGGRDEAAPLAQGRGPRYGRDVSRLRVGVVLLTGSVCGPIRLRERWVSVGVGLPDCVEGRRASGEASGEGAGVSRAAQEGRAGSVAILRLPLSAIIITSVLTSKAGAGADPLVIVGVVISYLVTLWLSARQPATTISTSTAANGTEPVPPSAAAQAG